MFLGYDVFALRPYLFKPYPTQGLRPEKRVSNYRLTRGRRISENLFGILANCWRIYHTVVILDPPVVTDNIATLALHNLLCNSRDKSAHWPSDLADSESSDGDIIYGSWQNDTLRESMYPMQCRNRDHNCSVNAKAVRET